ncbi:MAG: hypothetical protein EOO66_16115 [Methylobacterium sp.]|nr:MAG: hypothetical protein EOO66_16115 [Methylobacterium sp.]
MADQDGPAWELLPDLKTVRMTLPTTPPTGLELDAESLDALLDSLGELRARMQPPVSPTFSLGQVYDAVPHPVWMMETEVVRGYTILHLKDPRFGWLHYLLPADDALNAAGAVPPPERAIQSTS